MLTIANVTKRGTIDLDTERYIRVEDNKRDKTLLQKGDILFNWRNGSLDHIGKVAYWDDALGAPAHHVSFLLKLRTKETVADPFYLWAYMDGIHKSGFYARMSRRQVNVKFNSTELGAMKVPVPPLKLQQQFVARLEKAKDLIASQSGGSGKLANLQSSLLQRGFRGEL